MKNLRNNRFQELIICAIEQGYGLDLKPLYKYPVLDLGTYLKLRKILEGGRDGRKKENNN